jgi:hypothetical protein
VAARPSIPIYYGRHQLMLEGQRIKALAGEPRWSFSGSRML